MLISLVLFGLKNSKISSLLYLTFSSFFRPSETTNLSNISFVHRFCVGESHLLLFKAYLLCSSSYNFSSSTSPRLWIISNSLRCYSRSFSRSCTNSWHVNAFYWMFFSLWSWVSNVDPFKKFITRLATSSGAVTWIVGLSCKFLCLCFFLLVVENGGELSRDCPIWLLEHSEMSLDEPPRLVSLLIGCDFLNNRRLTLLA